MMKVGMPLLQSFDIVAKGHANPSGSKLVNEIRGDVGTGTSLTAAIKNAEVFLSMVTQIVSIREKSGSLDQVLDKVAGFHEAEAEVDDAVASLSSLIKSLIMLILAVLIGGLVIVMYFQSSNWVRWSDCKTVFFF